MSSKYKLVYSPHYSKVDLGKHVFPVKKYDLIRQKLLHLKLATEDEFIEAPKACEDDILLVHTKEYLGRLKEAWKSQGDWSSLMWQLEMPFCQTPEELMEASFYCVGGTILASRLALESGIGIHIGGGFHHAFPDHGEGFCVFNDIAVAIRKLKEQGKLERTAVIDCDLHQGNGTAFVFRNNLSVYTFSIHAQNIYPAKEKSDQDIGLPDFTDDQVYLGCLRECIPRILADFQPDLAVYIAGADPYKNDMLSPLNISIEGLRKRDEIVVSETRKNKIPLVIVLAGGYAQDVNDTVEIHCNTIKMALSTEQRESTPS